MDNPAAHYVSVRAAQPLPTVSRTRSGIQFTPESMRWVFRDGTENVSLNFELLPARCAPLMNSVKKALIWFLENRAPSTTHGYFSAFLKFSRFLVACRKEVIQRISSEDILAYKSSSAKAEHCLAGLRGFLVKWCNLGVAGIDQDVVDLLGNIHLDHYPVGVAVSTLDPEEGPFTDLELEAIQGALNNAYSQGEIDSGRLLLCCLFMALGARPVQLASLKCCDLIVPKVADGDYVLMVPRVKQAGQLARSEFKLRKLTRQIGEPLAAYVVAIRTEFSRRLDDDSQAPMFPQQKQIENANAPGFEFHASSSTVSQRVIKIFTSLRVHSERLAQSIPVSAIRFRRTFATRAAEEGWPLLVIAELMDHSDTRHVEVYAGLTTRIRATFSRKIAMEMAPIAMAFAGKIIRNEGEASRPGFSSRIVDLRIDQSGAVMGNCGNHSHCGFARPIACYSGCYDFEPWLDGPHDAALEYLLARRERLMLTTDARMASINDRAILGCAQVIERCRQLLAGEV